MSGILKNADKDTDHNNPSQTSYLLECSGEENLLACDVEESKVKLINELHSMNYNKIKPNVNPHLPLQQNEDAGNQILSKDGVNAGYEASDISQINDGRQLREKQVMSILSESFPMLNIASDSSKPRRNLLNAMQPKSHFQDIPAVHDQPITQNVWKKPQQRLPELFKPYTNPETMDTKTATSGNWKWHGTPRPIKPIKSPSLSDSSSKIHVLSSKEEIPLRSEDNVVEKTISKPKSSLVSKIPRFCSPMTSKPGRKGASKL